MIKTFFKFLNLAIEWFFRKKSLGLSLVGFGVAIFVALLAASLTLKFNLPLKHGEFSFSFDTAGGVSLTLLSIAVIVALGLTIVGIILIFIDLSNDIRKRVIAIELRGLRDTSGTPLKDKIPSKLVGRREQILLDIRQGADGVINLPDIAVQRILSLPNTISQLEYGLNRSDVSYVASALAPVPFSFLMGVLLDDESNIEILDWDRGSNNWRELDEIDDDRRFEISGMEDALESEDVALAISVSYPPDEEAISNTFPDFPLLKLILNGASFECHWSESKQAALAMQFLEIVRSLCNTKVKRIHLILVGPNSIAIRFGRAYDKRNLPGLIVYQYEKAQSPQYPWGVLMPVGGIANPKIISG